MLVEKISSEVLTHMQDKNRICPIFSGSCYVNGNLIKIRQADKEIELQASALMLKQIFDWCDGTTTVGEILQMVKDPQKKEEYEEFIHFLLTNDLLIDASNSMLVAQRYAWGGNAFGVQPAEEISGLISQRFTIGQPECVGEVWDVKKPPLDLFFDNRISSYTFAQKDSFDVETINTLLWSMLGVVSRVHENKDAKLMPRKTVASAGAMHLINAYLILLKPLKKMGEDLISPGVYKIHYPDARKIAYEKVNEDISLAMRSVAKPWLLSNAGGMIFLAANAELAGFRYRNRALQYLFIEAGQALQNGALTATSLDLGWVTFGSYYEDIVKKIIINNDELILSSAIWGALDKKVESERKECLSLDFAWADSPSELFSLPYFVGRATPRLGSIDRPTWGRDQDPDLAWRKAVGEAVERQGYREPKDLERGSLKNLANALDPREIVRFHKSQYRLKGFPLKPFDPDEIYYWALASDYFSDTPRLILSDLIFSENSLRQYGYTGALYYHSNSSGCAAGPNLQQARLNAVLELIERDGFMRHWLLQIAGVEIDKNSLPGSFLKRINAIEMTGFKVIVQTLPSTLAQVIFLFAQNDSLGCTCVSAGAKLKASEALDSALVELESRVFSLLHGHKVASLTPREVRLPDDHFALYAQRKYFHKADRLARCMQNINFSVIEKSDIRSVDGFYSNLQHEKKNIFFVDITPRQNGINQGLEALVAIRAFVPGLLPMSFGYGLEPRGMISDMHPAARFPHPFP